MGNPRKRSGNAAKVAAGLALAFSFAWLLAGVRPVQAEPYIAVREGLKCDFCHVNKTGGGKRTAAFGQTADAYLHAYPLPQQVEENARELTGVLGGRISLGANFRFNNTTLFRDDPDAQGRVENDQLFRPVDSNDFETGEGVAYLEADLIRERLAFYLDESFASGPATSREIFGLVRNLPWGGYLKAGRFFSPFGLRLEDDGAFIRDKTGFNFNNSSEGVELGLSQGGFFLAAALVNSDSVRGDNSQKQVSATGYYLHSFNSVLKTVMIGGSASHNPTTDRHLFGLHGGFTLWQLTVLAEGDLIDDGEARTTAVASHAEINWLALERCNIKLTYDYFDPDDTVKEDQRERYGLVLEPFWYKNLQTRLIYRSVNDIPQNLSGNFNELIAELHLFF